MGAAREILRLSQQNLAAMDEPEPAAAAQEGAASQLQPATDRAFDTGQQPSLQAVPPQPAKAPSMLPATSFLAMLHGKSQGPPSKPAESDTTAQIHPSPQGRTADYYRLFRAVQTHTLLFRNKTAFWWPFLPNHGQSACPMLLPLGGAPMSRTTEHGSR